MILFLNNSIEPELHNYTLEILTTYNLHLNSSITSFVLELYWTNTIRIESFVFDYSRQFWIKCFVFDRRQESFTTFWIKSIVFDCHRESLNAFRIKCFVFLLSLSKPWKLWNVDESLAGLVRHRVWRDDWSKRPRRSTLGDGGKFEGNPVAAQTKIVESFISVISGKLP